jgi:N-acetyltransferase
VQGWRNERVAWRGDDGCRVVHVAPGDPPAHAAKAAAVAEHVAAQLGLPPSWLLPDASAAAAAAAGQDGGAGGAHASASAARVHTFLLIASEGVVDGALFAEPLATAHRVRPAPGGAGDAAGAAASKNASGAGPAGGGVVCYEREAVPAGAGVRAVWVASRARRRGGATALLEAACARMCHGAPLPRQALAFSQPTEAGRALAERFTRTRAFLVYTDADVAVSRGGGF